MSTKFTCQDCNKSFNTATAFRMHKSRSRSSHKSGGLSCGGNNLRREEVRVQNEAIKKHLSRQLDLLDTNTLKKPIKIYKVTGKLIYLSLIHI